MRSHAPSGEAVLVLGSLNAKSQDRTLERYSVRPVQLISGGEIKRVPFFDSWGALGVSSLARHPVNPSILYVTTGTELIKIDLESQRVEELEVPGLHDVHEITVIGDILWLANTGSDEAIAYDVVQEKIAKRMSLSVDAPGSMADVHEAEAENSEVEVVDRFHCNQIFDGFDGDLYALIHHVSGKQMIQRIGRKLIKNQGNGGVINLTTGRAVPLDLKGPHSAQKVHDSYWIFDSGRATVNIYDQSWVLRGTLSTRGWGRGAAVSESLGLFYAGVSATRKRYLGVGAKSQHVPNMVRVFSIEGRAPVEDVELSGIEQVNNVYVIPEETALAMLAL